MDKFDQKDILRRIPAVDQLLLRANISSWVVRTSREFVVAEIQKLLQGIRDAIQSDSLRSETDITAEALEIALVENLQTRLRPNLRPVINATGVILHTNLGRALLSKTAQETLSASSANYTNLEYDISSGRR